MLLPISLGYLAGTVIIPMKSLVNPYPISLLVYLLVSTFTMTWYHSVPSSSILAPGQTDWPVLMASIVCDVGYLIVTGSMILVVELYAKSFDGICKQDGHSTISKQHFRNKHMKHHATVQINI